MAYSQVQNHCVLQGRLSFSSSRVMKKLGDLVVKIELLVVAL